MMITTSDCVCTRYFVVLIACMFFYNLSQAQQPHVVPRGTIFVALHVNLKYSRGNDRI